MAQSFPGRIADSGRSAHSLRAIAMHKYTAWSPVRSAVVGVANDAGLMRVLVTARRAAVRHDRQEVTAQSAMVAELGDLRVRQHGRRPGHAGRSAYRPGLFMRWPACSLIILARTVLSMPLSGRIKWVDQVRFTDGCSGGPAQELWPLVQPTAMDPAVGCRVAPTRTSAHDLVESPPGAGPAPLRSRPACRRHRLRERRLARLRPQPNGHPRTPGDLVRSAYEEPR
jgi:hypothetical protein